MLPSFQYMETHHKGLPAGEEVKHPSSKWRPVARVDRGGGTQRKETVKYHKVEPDNRRAVLHEDHCEGGVGGNLVKHVLN